MSGNPPTPVRLRAPRAILSCSCVLLLTLSQVWATEEETTNLPEVVVTGAYPQSYAVPTATTATKTDARLLDTPQAISVLPRAIIEDQGAVKLEDILKNTAGVNNGGFFGVWDYYRIRGFDVSYSATYLDGLLLDGAPGEEPFGMERVEVVKGPASTLYGQGPLGGLVNLVSKKPIKDNFADVRFSFGSHELYEPTLDAGIVLNKAGTVYLRLNALYRNENSFVDYASSERIYVAPSLTWEIGPNTTLTILASYKADYDNLAFALPARGTVLPNRNGKIPSNRYIGNPETGNSENERTVRLGYQFNHTFNDYLKLRQNFRYSWLYSTSSDLSYPDSLDPDDRTLAILGYANTARFDALRVDTALDANFETGPVKHILTAGIDYRVTTNRYDSRDAVDYVYLDLFKPNYGALPRYSYGAPYWDKDRDSDLGVYVQEQAKFFDKVTLTLGGRFDFTDLDAMPGKYNDDAFTPKVGLAYEFLPGVAVYGNYSKSYNPQWFSTDSSGQPVAPEEGENWEGGLKFDLLRGKLTGMLSVYQLTRQNVATDNITTPDPTDAIVSGEQRSRGFEFEMTAEIVKGLDFTAAYTYIDAKITKDNALPVGARLFAVPEHNVNAWLKYTIQTGTLKGFGVGVGGHYYSAQKGDETYQSDFELPSYAVMDVAAYYDRGPFHAQVNVDNVLDREYYVGAYNDLYVLPGEPISVRATVGWKF